MSKTLLQFMQDAADLLSLTRPSVVISATDDTTTQLLAISNRVGRDLVNQGGATGFDELQRLATFTTVASQAEYDLPSDYDRAIDGTVWDRSQRMPIAGALSPSQWQTIKSGLLGSGISLKRFRIFRSATGAGRKFTIDPTPTTGGETLVMEYVSKNWCVAADGTTTQNAWAADTDTFLLNDDLMLTGIVWRWRREKGMDYSGEKMEFDDLLRSELSQNRPAKILDLAYRGRKLRLVGPTNVPDTGYG